MPRPARLLITAAMFLGALAGLAFAQQQSGGPSWLQLTYEVTPGGLGLQSALTGAANAGGGTVHVFAGSYAAPGTPFLIGSNTKLVCDPGVTFTSTNAGWTGAKALLNNVNWSASVITDHDITVKGCGWVANGSFATDGGYHHISFRMAQHIRVDDKNSFTGGGDGTSMLATIDTVVAGNYMTDAQNACWDHWDAPLSVVVRNNWCQTKLYGILVTGSDTVASAGQAVGGDIDGNITYIAGATGAAAGIWTNGLGTAGSGASHIKVSHNYTYGDGTSNFECAKNSGASDANIFDHNSCGNTGTNSQGFSDTSDSGGSPTNTVEDHSVYDGVQVQSGNIAVVQLLGTGATSSGDRIIGGSYPSAFWVGGTNNKATSFFADAGSASGCNLTGATTPLCSSLGGGLSLIASITASGQSTLPLVWGTVPYPSLELDCTGIISANNNIGLGLQISKNGGTSYLASSYRYSGTAYDQTGGATNPNNGGSTVAQIPVTTHGVSSAQAFNLTATIPLLPAAGANNIVSSRTDYANANDSPNLTIFAGNGSYTGSTGAPNAIQLMAQSTDTFSSGQCNLYGKSSS